MTLLQGLLACAVVVLLLGIGVACTRPGTPTLATVADATSHPRATHLTLTGQSHPGALGIGTWQTRAVRGAPDAVKGHAMWVVPVTDPGATPTDPVRAWVTYSGKVDEGDPPDAWFTRLREGFDGRTVTLRVSVRASERPDSGWSKAIRDAEARHGLRSHPDAPVLAFP